MTVIRLRNNMYLGLSTDAKPTNVANGSRFLETDTESISLWNGTSWVTNIVRNNLNNNLGAFYEDLQAITAPGSPSANTIRLYVDSSGGHLKGKDSSGNVYDILTPASGQLPNSVVYNNQNNNLGAFYEDLQAITAPATPGANTDRLYVDSNTVRLTVKDPNGTIYDLCKPTAAQLPASVVYNNQNNALGAFWESLTEIAKPTNPASGTRIVYVDSTSHAVSSLDSGGTIHNLESQTTVDDLPGSSTSGYWMGTGNAWIYNVGMLARPQLTGNSPILVAPSAPAVTAGQINPIFTTLESTGSGTVHGGINMLAGVTKRSKNCLGRFKFALLSGTASNSRMWMGFTDQTVVMTNASNPLNSQSGVIFGYQRSGTDSGATGNWTIGSNNGGANMTFNDTGTAVDTVLHTVAIQANDAVPNFVVTTDVGNATLTSTIPATGTNLNFFIEAQNPGTTTVTASFAWADLTG